MVVTKSKKKTMKSVNGVGAEIGFFFMSIYFSIMIGVAYLLSLWTDRSLEFWLSYAKGKPVEVPQWLSFVLTVVLNAVIVTANIVSELVRLVVE